MGHFFLFIRTFQFWSELHKKTTFHLLWRAFYVATSPVLSNQCRNIFKFLSKWKSKAISNIAKLTQIIRKALCEMWEKRNVLLRNKFHTLIFFANKYSWADIISVWRLIPYFMSALNRMDTVSVQRYLSAKNHGMINSQK